MTFFKVLQSFHPLRLSFQKFWAEKRFAFSEVQLTLYNVYIVTIVKYGGNENTVLGIAEKDDIRASWRWVVKVI